MPGKDTAIVVGSNYESSAIGDLMSDSKRGSPVVMGCQYNHCSNWSMTMSNFVTRGKNAPRRILLIKSAAFGVVSSSRIL